MTTDPCPACGEPLTATPRGTWRACLACRQPVTPAAVSAPYARGGGGPGRQVVSQAERDLEAIALARRKGIMLSQLGQLADDDRLANESRPVVEWFAAEVRAATSGNRLDELARLLPQAGIRRRRWWHGQPAAIEAGHDEDQADEDDYDDEDQADEDQPPAAPLRPAVEWAAELAIREWEVRPHGPGACQLVHLKPHGWDYVPPQECPGRATHTIPGAAVCDSCWQALTWSPRSPAARQ